MRHFYRCHDCFTVVALEVKLAVEYGRAIANCGACQGAGSVEYMGRVEGDGLVFDRERCACDERCTSAKGPLCSCSCGGKNHGAGMGAVVQYLEAAGRIPTLTPARQIATAAAVGAEYRAKRAALRAAIQRLVDRKAEAFLPAPEFRRLCDLQRLSGRIGTLRSHATRMRDLGAAGF